MTDNEIIDVISPLCGWVKREVFEPSFSNPRQLVSRGLKWHDPNGIQRKRPDYPRDLNAIHEAEKILNSPQQRTYAEYLSKGVDGVRNQTVALYHATARQRAEAFIKTICPEKWKGDA